MEGRVVMEMINNIETERLLLKPLSFEHVTQNYLKWLNDEDIYKYLEVDGDYTLDMLRNYVEDMIKKNICFWAIHIKSNGLHIGNIKIDPINQRHGFAEYGIMMGEKSEWNKGYAKEATKSVIKFCFDNLNIRKITLGVVSDNISAVNLYKSLDFNVEGVYKNHGIYMGKYCDILRMALFNPEFKYD